jgi:hypothetical protein
MFLASIVSALKLDKMRHLHSHWTSLVTNCLPFLDQSLPNTVLEVTSQLASNLERLAPFYDSNDDLVDLGQIPADYVITQLEAMTMMYHFCLIEAAEAVNVSSLPSNLGGGQASSGAGQVGPNVQSGEILNNLLHVFLSHSEAKALVASSMEASGAHSLEAARKALLTTLPRLVSCCAILWTSVDKAQGAKEASSLLVGAPKAVRLRLLDLLSPIAHHHSVAFLSAIGITWQERRSPGTHGLVKNPLPVCNEDQQILVDLVGAIKTMPVSTVIQTVRQVLRAPPNVAGNRINVEVAVLQFFYAYLAKCSAVQVFESWSGLASLLRECLILAPPAIFLALAILNQFAHRAPSLAERKDQKELQEIAGKLIDACAQVRIKKVCGLAILRALHYL